TKYLRTAAAAAADQHVAVLRSDLQRIRNCAAFDVRVGMRRQRNALRARRRVHDSESARETARENRSALRARSAWTAVFREIFRTETVTRTAVRRNKNVCSAVIADGVTGEAVIHFSRRQLRRIRPARLIRGRIGSIQAPIIRHETRYGGFE